MAEIQLAFAWVLRHEGGYSNDHLDHGGETKYGITAAVARANGFIGDMHDFTIGEAARIYRSDYWRFDGLTSQRVATKVFDMSVNIGLHTAVRLLQEALAILGASIDTDGNCGPFTVITANAADPEAILGLLSTLSAKYYQSIVDQKPDQARFINGWLARAKEIPV